MPQHDEYTSWMEAATGSDRPATQAGAYRLLVGLGVLTLLAGLVLGLG